MRYVHLSVIAVFFWAATAPPAVNFLSHSLWVEQAWHAATVLAGVAYGYRAVRSARSYAA